MVKSKNTSVKPYKINREILNVGDVAFALCYSPEEKKFYFIKLFRTFYFIRKEKYLLEMVGGLVDKGESVNSAIKREIFEEIRVKTKKLKKLTTYCPVPGYSDEIVHLYYAEVDKIELKTLFNKFENEEIRIYKLTLSQLLKINKSNKVENVLTKLAIYEYLNKIKKN